MGAHIAQQPNPDYNMHGDFSEPDDQVVIAMARRIVEAERKLESQQTVKNRFDWTINTGNVIAILTILLSVGGASFTGYSAYKEQQRQNDSRFDEVLSSIKAVQSATDQNRKDIDQNQKDALVRQQVYSPRLDLLEKALQAEQINAQGMRDSVRSLRDDVTDLVKLGAQTHETVAVMAAKMDRDGQKGPHS